MNRFLDRWVSWIFYLLAYRKLPTSYAHWALQESKNNSEIRSFLTPMTAKSNSTILQHDTREIKLQGTLKKTPRIPDLSNADGFPCSVCFHYSRRIPLSLGSVLEFRYQSLTLKYIEIGLLPGSSRCSTAPRKYVFWDAIRVFCWSAVHLNKPTKCRQLLNGFTPWVLSRPEKSQNLEPTV